MVAEVVSLPQPVVGVALRRSHAEDDAAKEPSTEQQLTQIRRHAELLGFTIAEAHIYREAGVSGSKRQVRNEMERLLAAVEAGDLDVVVCWKWDRLARDRHYRNRLLDLVDERRLRIIGVADGLDTDTPTGSFFADLFGAMARQEAQNISTNTRRGLNSRREAGKPSGNPRPYGFADNRIDHVPAEAALLREAGRRIRAGQGLNTITKDWNARGERLPDGAYWSPTPLRRKLLAPRVGGFQSPRGEPLPDITATWEAIIPADEWWDIRRVLLDPARRKGGRPVRFLLSGFLICGVCSHHPKLAGRSDRSHGQKYLCPGPASGGCYLSVSASDLEHHVSAKALDLLTDDRVYRALEAASTDDGRVRDLYAERDRLLVRQRELADQAADPAVPLSLTVQAAQQVDARLKTLEREVVSASPKRGLFAIGLGDVLDAWGAATLDDQGKITQRRDLLALVLDHATVYPAKRANRFDPKRVKIVWAEELLSDATIAAVVARVTRGR